MSNMRKNLFSIIISLIIILLWGINLVSNEELTLVISEQDKQVEENNIEDNMIFYDSGMDYTETYDIILNPERGFYQHLEGSLSPTNPYSIWTESFINAVIDQFSLFHLRISLEHFSKNAGGVDQELNETALDSLRNSLEVFRNTNASIIVRFSYNLKGLVDSDGKYLNSEPPIELIEIHIQQLGEILNDYYDIIASIDTGMFGPWAEQHSTILGNDNIENAFSYYRLIEAWLKALPEACITVRRPIYYIYWANIRYDLDLTTSNINMFKASDYPQYPDLKRVGIYNDGYLGSYTDLRTYTDRETELTWLNDQAKYTLFGGEVVADIITGGIGEYNCISYLEFEGFFTHLSYLNYYWNYNDVILVWENSIYQGTNEHYHNKTSEFVYIANHLGYRFVLRDSKIAYETNDKKIYLQGKIENVGFGNVVNEKKTEIILKSSESVYYVNIDFDVRQILSNDIYYYYFEIDIPKDFFGRKYNILIKISDINEKETTALRTIRFANDIVYWDSDLGANKIGEIPIEFKMAFFHILYQIIDGF